MTAPDKLALASRAEQAGGAVARTIALTVHEIEAIYDAGRSRGSDEAIAFDWGSIPSQAKLDKLKEALVWRRGCSETRELREDYDGSNRWWSDFLRALASTEDHTS